METRNTLIKISIELAKNQLDFACHLVAKSSQIDATKGAKTGLERREEA